MNETTADPAIAGLNLAQGLNAEGVAALETLGTRQQVVKGDEVVMKGDDGEALYAVLSGSIIVKAGDGRLVSVMGPGDTFGEIGFLTGSRRTANVVAQSDAELLRLPGEAVRSLVSERPEIAAFVYSNLARELAKRLTTTTQMALL